MNRRIGLEQEFFVVESGGEASHKADDLVRACRDLAAQRGLSPNCFETEWVKNIIEINTPPAATCDVLASSYRKILEAALDAAENVGVRLYPYAAYPLHLIPTIRNEVAYHIQVRTVGRERFLNAGKCAGTHVHLEAPPGVIDARVGVSYDVEPQSRAELLNLYNLATALDPALIALSRASPFYEGRSSGLAHRTARYRGSAKYGWEGVYTDLPEVGQLRPYAESIEQLVQLQFQRHCSWLNALEAAEVSREIYEESRGNLLASSWNPVRLNAHNTVELRNIDSNLPQVVLSVARLIFTLRERVVRDGLIVTPTSDVANLMQVRGDRLLTPDFETLESKLLFAAVSEGLESSLVSEYADSVLEASGLSEETATEDAMPCFAPDYKTTEAILLEEYYPASGTLSLERGMELVRRACDDLEGYVRSPQSGPAAEVDL